MKGRWRLLIFAVGCIVLFAAFTIGYTNEAVGESAYQTGIMQILTGFLGIMVLVLGAIGILNVGKERWSALSMCAILLLGFSALMVSWAKFSGLVFARIGLLTATAALIMLVFSTMSSLNIGRAGWRALTIIGILLVGLSTLTLFSVGWLIAPAALIMLIFSVSKLRHDGTKRSIP